MGGRVIAGHYSIGTGGYYFVVFRAVESQKSRQRRLLTDLSVNPSLTESSIIAEVSVYLVVFREGILSVSVSIEVKRMSLMGCVVPF